MSVAVSSVKTSDSSPARGPPGPERAPLESSGQDELNGIRLKVVAFCSCQHG